MKRLFLSVIVVLFYIMVFWLPEYLLSFSIKILVWISLASAWNLIAGFTGYISLGHGAYYGLSAYIFAVLTAYYGFPPLLSLVVSVAATTLASTLGYAPLRLTRGIYFAVITIVTSELLRSIVSHAEVSVGKVGIAFEYIPTVWGYSLMLTFTLISLVIIYLFTKTKSFVACKVIREDELTAKTCGVNSTKYKVLVFTISVFICALMGSSMAWYLGYVDTNVVFSIAISFNMAIIAIFGGAGTFVGPIIGSIIVTTIQEVFGTSFSYLHLLFTGVLFIVIVLWLPTGIMGILSKEKIGKLIERWFSPK